MSLSLHHLALGARNVEDLATFYVAGFGLCESARHHHADGKVRSIWLQLESGVLMIEGVEAEAAAGLAATDKIVPGMFLLCFRVSPETIADRERRLVELGAAFERRSSFTSYLRDPEGNRIALSHYLLP